MQDLFGDEVAPPEPRRSVRQHTPAQGALVLYETLGSAAKREGFPPDALGAETFEQSSSHRTHRVPTPPGPAERHPRRAPAVLASATSEAAAAALDPRTLNAKREEVLRVFCNATYPMSDNRLIEYMVQTRAWSPNTPRPRRVELVRDGWLQDSGQKQGRSVAWEPTPAAREWFASLAAR